jgi:tetratricopeptide (TPR) repeat protein
MTKTARALCGCFLVLVLIPILTGTACRHRVQVQFPQQLFDDYLRKGDDYFAKGHLWGWRKAEDEYRKAWAMAQPDELLERRVTTLVLMAVRERDEYLFATTTRQELQALGPVTGTKLRILVWLAGSYGLPGIHLLPAGLPDLSESIFNLEESAADAYLYLALLRTCAPGQQAQLEESLIERFRSSPLFAYWYPVEDLVEILDVPDFAELHAYQAHLAFSRQQFKRARDEFVQCLEFLPDHTLALNTLGDLYLFGLQAYRNALQYYDASLRVDPRNLEALFGKAVIFHYLGQYGESNRVFDRVLEGDARWDHLSDKQRNYYRGQAYYYKAYNAYLLADIAAARRLVDTSRTYLPRFGGSCYLSGLMHYRNREVDPAERDFATALSEGTSYCDASYYLGMIDRASRDGSAAPSYFLACADCYRTNLVALKKRLQGISKMDLTEMEKQALRGQVRSEISEFSESSTRTLQKVMEVLPELDFEGKELQTQLISEVLEQLKSARDADDGNPF